MRHTSTGVRTASVAAVTVGLLVTGCSGDNSRASSDDRTTQATSSTSTPAPASASAPAPASGAESSEPAPSATTKTPRATPSTGGPAPTSPAPTTPAPTKTEAPAAPATPATAKAQDQTAVLNSLPGSAGSGCVVVGSNRDMRAGTIAVGNFVDARKKFAAEARSKEQPEISLYVIPRTSAKLDRATVSLAPAGGGKATNVTSKAVEQADIYSYFAVNVPVPGPGAYRLTVTSGSDTGCFTVKFATS